MQITTHDVMLVRSLYMKWAADSDRDSISWVAVRDIQPADAAVNQDSGSRATLSPMLWWTCCWKLSPPT